ncbi:hypothetical protein LMG10661_03842 [Ralstonia syzygii subsp. syzygii]|nr:hypothetical protein LMG10661_03842 [Ralstonia syzygii subsp. syzygii]
MQRDGEFGVVDLGSQLEHGLAGRRAQRQVRVAQLAVCTERGEPAQAGRVVSGMAQHVLHPQGRRDQPRAFDAYRERLVELFGLVPLHRGYDGLSEVVTG